MTVVHIIEALAGGVYSYFKDLSHHFGDRDDIKTVIIYNKKRKEINPDNIKNEFSQNVTLINLDMERELNLKQDFIAVFQIRKLLKQIKPDIVHLHSSKASIIGRLAAQQIISKKNIFYTPHGYSFLSSEFSKTKKEVFYQIEKYTQFLLGGTTIACGDTEFEIGRKIGKSKLVRNGIDVENIKKHRTATKENKLTVGILGRITQARNPSLFNTIALQNPDYQFLWIGDGELRSLITAPNITITGWSLDRDETMKNLNRIDIYLQTSLWEGLPIALLEAMALKKPLVATNIIGNKDIIVNNETGYLFNDVKEIDQIFKLLESKENRNRLGEKGFQRCNEIFNNNKNFETLASIYRESLK
jgi:glycosyltransferase involved in cell wall biosynthesis